MYMLNLSVKAQSIVFNNRQVLTNYGVYPLTGIGVTVSASKLSLLGKDKPLYQSALYQFTGSLGTGRMRWRGAGFLSCCRSNGRLPRGARRKPVGLCESSLASTFVMSSLSQGSCRRIGILFLPVLWSLSDSSPLIPLGPSFLIIVSNCFCSFLREWKASSITFSRSSYR